MVKINPVALDASNVTARVWVRCSCFYQGKSLKGKVSCLSAFLPRTPSYRNVQVLASFRIKA